MPYSFSSAPISENRPAADEFSILGCEIWTSACQAKQLGLFCAQWASSASMAEVFSSTHWTTSRGTCSRSQPIILTSSHPLGRSTIVKHKVITTDTEIEAALIKGVYGNRRWMAELGRKGGAAKTETRRRAARKNGAKGGRPKRVIVPARRIA